MTNTNFISDLELIEGSLKELKQLSQLEIDTPNINKLINERLKEALPEVIYTLGMQEILNAQKDGLTIMPEDIQRLVQRNTTIEEVLQTKRVKRPH